MESYIAELEAERVRELEAYLRASGLSNYTLTKDEKLALQAIHTNTDSIGVTPKQSHLAREHFLNSALSALAHQALERQHSVQWQTFSFDSLFLYKRGKRYKKSDHVSGDIAYISSSASNNGVDNFVSPPPYMTIYQNKLTLANSGSVGACFYHSYQFVASDHCMVIWLKERELSKEIALFLIPIFEKLKNKHDFGREINDERLRAESFLLPIDSKGNLDFDFMEHTIKAVEKLHIKRLYEFWEAKLNAYNLAINNGGGG
nr:restriction endonuclease subunit S [Helicobacter valdiviensis]